MTLIRTRSVHALGGPRVELGVWVILPGWAAHSRTKLGCPTRTDCDAVKNVWLWILGAFGFWPRFRAPGSLSATSCMWRHPNCGENPWVVASEEQAVWVQLPAGGSAQAGVAPGNRYRFLATNR